MRMNFDVTGVDQEPFKVGRIDESLQQLFPDTLVAPADKTAMGVGPSTLIGREIAPRGPRAEKSKHRINKPSVVLGPPSPNALSSRQMRCYYRPNVIRDVVSSMCWKHSLFYHV